MLQVHEELLAYHDLQYSRDMQQSDSKAIRIGALAATVLMAAGCTMYIFLCISLCIHRCMESYSTRWITDTSIADEVERNAATAEGLMIKVRSTTSYVSCRGLLSKIFSFYLATNKTFQRRP